MKIEHYRTATGETLDELDVNVNRFIGEGYQPFGSPYYIGKTEGNVDAPICQAVVKLAKTEQAKPQMGAMVG
jgi:hypothetical protein